MANGGLNFANLDDDAGETAPALGGAGNGIDPPKPVGNGNSELDNFFEGKSTSAGTSTPGSLASGPPPPPSFVDKRDFVSSTPGGFGSGPIGGASQAGGSSSSSSFSGPQSAGAFFVQNAQVLSGMLSGIIGNNQAASGVAAVAKEKYQSYIGKNMRSWKDFVIPVGIPKDSVEACSNMRQNLTYFQTNYGMMYCSYLVFSLITSFWSLVTLSVLAMVWFLFIKKNDDPEWMPEIAGVTLHSAQRWGIMFLTTVVLILLVSGSLIFWSSLFFAMIAAVHATIHVPPVGEELPLPGQFGGDQTL